MLKSDALVSGLVDRVITNNTTESVSPPAGFPVFSPSRTAFLPSSLQVKKTWSDREEKSSFSCVLRLTVTENLHLIQLFAFISWCSNLITGITLLLCFEVVSKQFNSQLIKNSFVSIWRPSILI